MSTVVSAIRPARRKSITLHDVAREAGVSLITASRALSNPGLVSAQTIARVHSAVEATGYIPNLIAGGLKSKRSLMVATLVPNIAVAQFLPTVQALTSTLEAAGYQVMLGQSGYDADRERALLNAMISRRPDGIVIMGALRNPEQSVQLRQLGIPVVETWELSDRPIDMVVGFSHAKVGAAVGGFFLSKRWKKIGVALGDDRRARLRSEAFAATIGRALPTVVVPPPSSIVSGREAMRDLLAQEPALEAVYCSSDQLAQGVIAEAHVRGMRVPQDVAVCGFGDADFAAHMSPSLTTVQVDGVGIGTRAAQMIVARCNGEAIAEPVVDLGFRLVERESTGKRRTR